MASNAAPIWAWVALTAPLVSTGRPSALFREGLARFEDAAELKTFLAMTLHNLGRSKEGVELLLAVLAQSSADAHIQEYREAILFYAQDIDRSWPNAS
jgi:hypothetical protein